MTPIIECPIWGNEFTARSYGEIYCTETDRIPSETVMDSPRAGGRYRLSDESHLEMKLYSLNQKSKARLTTWLIDRRKHGDQIPVISMEIVDHFKETSSEHDLSMLERSERLLHFLVEQTTNAGKTIEILHDVLDESLAWSESIDADELEYLIKYLHQKEFIVLASSSRADIDIFYVTVSVDGHEHAREVAINPDSRQAFVAMWFAPEMDDAYEKGIKPAITNAGYNPQRIDKKDDVQKIDDEIFAEIRRSKFLVADMTQGDDGARGGVYFEAGFAQGLGIPVLYTCRKDKMENLSFDTRQLYHVEWEEPHELYEQLVTRILAVVGEGPLVIEN